MLENPRRLVDLKDELDHEPDLLNPNQHLKCCGHVDNESAYFQRLLNLIDLPDGICSEIEKNPDVEKGHRVP